MAALPVIRMKKFHFRHLSFRQLLALSFVAVASILMLAMGLALSAFSGRYIQKNYQETHNSYMELFSASVDEQIESLTDDMRSLLEEDTFLAVLEEGNPDSAYFTSGQQRILEKYMYGLLDDNTHTRGMVVISASGNFRCLQRSGKTLSTLADFYRDGDILDESWIAETTELQGREKIYGWNLLDPLDETVFTVAKEMIDPKTHQAAGYMAIMVSKNMLLQIFGSHNDILEDNRFLIVDTEKTPGDEHYLVCSNNMEESQKEEILKAYNTGNQKIYVFGCCRSSETSWEIISVITRKELWGKGNYVRQVVAVCFLVMLVLLIPLAGVLSDRIHKPLEKLERTIAEVGSGNYHPDVEFEEDEVGKVGQYLLSISENNLELREKLLQTEITEREAQLQLLQSQINPHFLYNTLDALYFMAIIDEADDIAEMVKALSDMFRLSLNKGEETITIRSELQKMEAYMKIQNMRYQNRFTLEIDVDEGIMEERILTFLLQPIIENAVTHGLEKKIGEGTVSIIGYLEGEILHMTIHDNGAGIPDMRCVEQGYGIRNVRERIRLYYGAAYDVSFESEPGEGTTVFFRLPRIQEKTLLKKKGNLC